MSVRRFVGVNSREAMREVRASLGDDALILSNRRSDDGVEILALAEDDHGRMTESPQEVSARSPSTPVSPALTQSGSDSREAPHPTSDTSETSPVGHEDFAALSRQLLGEMQDMREMLSRRTPASDSGTAVSTHLRQRLVSAGFSMTLGDDIVAMLPDELTVLSPDDPRVNTWLTHQLMSSLQTPDDEASLLDEAGVIALVGPTGVGKTTTTAKLAARYVMQHGSDGVALVTTDGYRIGAHDQLRIYADLLGIDIHALDSEADLASQLTRLDAKRLIIIDTVGMSQRDQRLVQQISALAQSRPVRLMLVLSAASQGETLDDVVSTYRQAADNAGSTLQHCILTKQDEAARLGPVLDSVIRHGLVLHYVSHGQQVPEDLSPAERHSLIDEALAAACDSPYTPDTAQLSARGIQLQQLSRGLLGQGRGLASAFESLRREVPGFMHVEAAWSLCHLPRSRQPDAWQSLESRVLPLARDVGKRSAGLMLLWGPVQHAGSDWAMPVQMVGGNGLPTALNWLRHRLPASGEERLDWASRELGVSSHVFSRCPTVPVMEWLAAWQLPWIAAAQHNTKVTHGGERVSLASLVTLASPAEVVTIRCRGRRVSVALSALDVSPGQSGSHTTASALPLQAWFGTLTDADSGREMGRRFWLVSPQAMEVSVLLERQMVHAELPALTRQAWQGLADAGLGDSDAALKLSLASGLASTAVRLEQDGEMWAMDTRAKLLNLLNGQRQRRARRLLEALLQAFVAQDALSELGASRRQVQYEKGAVDRPASVERSGESSYG
ncbi:flagellar biosynthesis protein FlhF [Aidingimonas halophila]|uniref:Flagellar biosynthesis protein FlhF n=1 Tax=Aidingimonas halophila TaxID=574349 RepID=A0A1H3GE92_9GAMM|nr:flagellar biosynthesis protein FlhF [Aidingimonas halophila]GHC33086.1 flagellar biosynthesis protein [Aidingimonas halophila]SDY01643.1 flagellar biosynthesis protein FlhF [Aidingimonas halophila]